MTTTFAEWLRAQMYARGGHRYKGASLARESGVAAATISALLNGVSEPTRPTIERMAAVFGITSREIYEAIGKTPPDDLDDIREQIIAIVFQLSEAENERVLKELVTRYGKRKPTSKK